MGYFVFSFIILCFLISISNKKKAINQKDYFFLATALFLTCVGDFCITLNNYFLIGLIFFTLVQFFYVLRYNFNNFNKGFFIKIIFAYSILLTVSHFFINDYIISVGLGYVFLFFINLYSVFKSYFEKKIMKPNIYLMVFGMSLFFMCDVCVMLRNTVYGFNNNSFIYYLIWIFYLPSQFLLSISGKKFN